jgi:hypothetical protein
VRPELWMVPNLEARLAVGRLAVAALAFVFGLLPLALDRPARR